MITYRFTSQTFLGQTVKVQYSKYDSNTRIDLGSGTFPFQYTTDQLAGTYYFYIPSVDRTFPKVIDIPPIDIFTEEINVPDCDISGVTIFVPPCDIDYGIVEVPVCDIEYQVEPQTSNNQQLSNSKFKSVFYKTRESLIDYVKEDDTNSILFSSVIFSMVCYESDFTIPNDREVDKIIEFEVEGQELNNIPTGYLLVMIKNSSDYEDATKYFSDNNLVIEKYFTPYRTFFIRIESDELKSKSIYEINDEIIKENFCKYSVLDTISKLEFNYQIPYESSYHWYLQDIKSREAWELIDNQPEESTYGGYVEVAMIDTQIDAGHPEIVGKISEYSFNPYSLYWSEIQENEIGINFADLSICAQQNGETSIYRLFHGTGTIGLLAASNSNNDLMYSASNDKVKVQVIAINNPVEVINGICQTSGAYQVTATGGLVAMLNRIYENPNCVSIVTAAVWGENQLIQEAITILTNEGRNGKGIPFFGSSGNQSQNQNVVYPGVFNDVYSVGATNEYGNKAGFSQYGNNLFICAPGEKIMSLSPRGRFGKDLGLIYTIPRPPRVPKNLKDIIFTNQSLQVSDGTSSSVPIVGAIAATMVYVNPSLTKTQIINILSDTARKSLGTEGQYVFSNGKNLQLGYGIVDHEEAIKESIRRIPVPIDPSDDEPILVKILRLPESVPHGGTTEIVFEITLLQNIVLGTEYLKAEIYVGDNEDSGFFLISEFTYTEFSQVTSFTETIEIPLEPFGLTRNKYIKVIAKSFDELDPLPTGEQFDYSIIQINSPIDYTMNVNLELTLLGVECLNNGIPCNQENGYAWKIKVLNTGNVGIIRCYFNIYYDGPPQGGCGFFLGSEGFYSNVTSSSFDLTDYFETIYPNEERVLYVKNDSFLNINGCINQNFPVIVAANCVRVINSIQEYDPETGISFDAVSTSPQLVYSNTLEITQWPG